MWGSQEFERKRLRRLNHFVTLEPLTILSCQGHINKVIFSFQTFNQCLEILLILIPFQGDLLSHCNCVERNKSFFFNQQKKMNHWTCLKASCKVISLARKVPISWLPIYIQWLVQGFNRREKINAPSPTHLSTIGSIYINLSICPSIPISFVSAVILFPIWLFYALNVWIIPAWSCLWLFLATRNFQEKKGIWDALKSWLHQVHWNISHQKHTYERERPQGGSPV